MQYETSFTDDTDTDIDIQESEDGLSFIATHPYSGTEAYGLTPEEALMELLLSL